MWKRGFCHIHNNITFSAKQRMDKIMGASKWYDTSLAPIPKEVKGLGYRYQPILYKSNKIIRKWKVTNSDGVPLLKEEEVIKNIVKSLLKLQHTHFLHGDLNKRFLDPLEVENSITQLKDEGLLLGFLFGVNSLKVSDFVFSQYSLSIDTSYHLQDGEDFYEIKMCPRKDNRIFTHHIEISLIRKVPIY